jgi:hypothetical protein
MSFPRSCPACGAAIRFTADTPEVAHCAGCRLSFRLDADDEPVRGRLNVDEVLASAHAVAELRSNSRAADSTTSSEPRVGPGRLTAFAALIVAAAILVFVVPWSDDPDPDGWSDIPPPPFDGKLPDPKDPKGSKLPLR